ncbi:hypothetical protein [Aeromicrobium sp. P5_D10]
MTSGEISYAGPPTTSRRVLELDLRRSLIAKGYQPTVAIDGQRYVCDWGRWRFEIPADRPVHVSVHIEHRRPVGAASLILDPSQPPQLEYSAPAHLSQPGSLGPQGTTTAKGKGTMGCLLVGLVLTLLCAVLFIAAMALTIT